MSIQELLYNEQKKEILLLRIKIKKPIENNQTINTYNKRIITTPIKEKTSFEQ